jgi:uncharacterized protein YukE
VASLTPSDVKRWDPDAIHQVFQTASNRAHTLQQLGDNLQQVHNGLSDWQGEAGEAFRADLGQTRRDIEADGQESRQVATAVSAAEADVRACRLELDSIQHAADANSWAITPDWRIDVGNTLSGPNSGALAVEQQLLQGQLDAVKVHAHNTDHELAMAVRAAVGQAPAGAGAPAPPSAPKPQAGEPPKSWKDMLPPAGPANGGPGAGGAPKGPPVPAGAGGGKPPSLGDMMLGRGEPADQKPPPGSPLDLLSRLSRPGAPGGAPAPQLKPADVESFKAMARQTMINDGVPPDQIEGRLNDVVGRTQQWMDNGMPNYVPPEPPKPPPPGFGDGVGDTWFGFNDAVHKLTGQEGIGPMADELGGMARGLGGRAEEYLLQGPVAPINDLTHEFKSFMDNPAYYAGGKTAEGAIALPGMLFGPEGAGIAEVGDADALAYSPVLSPHAPIGFDNPTGIHPWSGDAASDLNSAFGHGEPTGTLSQSLADMATHYIGDNPDRVVLGKFDGLEDGYIGEARGHGGIYFDTSQDVWSTMTHGLSTEDGNALGWRVNENFLRSQMESGVSRIDYVVDPTAYSSVEEVLALRPDSFSAKEITFLKDYGESYGYQQVGDSWVRVADGAR